MIFIYIIFICFEYGLVRIYMVIKYCLFLMEFKELLNLNKGFNEKNLVYCMYCIILIR